MSPDGLSTLESILQRQEGLRLKSYRDTTGHLSIGYGRNIDAVGISQDEAAYMLSNDTQRVLNDISTHMPWALGLSEPRACALASWVFNEGISGVMAWKPTIEAIKAKQWQIVHDHILGSLAAEQAPNRYKEIANIFLTGVL